MQNLTPLSGVIEGQAWPVLRVSGAAAGNFLQRLLSNDVGKITSAQAVPAFLLEPTGRIVAGAWFMRAGDDYLALCPSVAWRQALRTGLEKYRLTEVVDFAFDDRAAAIWLNPPAPLHQKEFGSIVQQDQGLAIASDDYGSQAVLWLGAPPKAPTVSAAAAERLRVQTLTPAFDRELTKDTIPLEAGLYGWLSNRKGCYVGQEVIERMWSRERVARRLARYATEGEPPAQALPLNVAGDDGKGLITSIAAADSVLLGLGYYSGTNAGAVRDQDGRTWRVEPVVLKATL